MTDTSHILARLEAIEAKLDKAPLNGERWPEWMKVSTAARYSDCSEWRIWQAIKNKRLHPSRPDDGGARKSRQPEPRIKRADLDAWHEAGRPTRPVEVKKCDTMGGELRTILESRRAGRM